MEYLIGVIVVAVVIFFFAVKNKTDKFNKQTLLQFSTWHSLYISSEMPETHGTARAFLEQTLHLAHKTGVLSSAEKQELELGSRQENPMRMVNEWLELALPNVLTTCGERELSNLDARLVGVCMLVCLKGINPQRDLKRFLE
jgi:hypothetical protein